MPRPDKQTFAHLEFAKRVKMRRESLGLTREQVANAIGVKPSTVRMYETGRRIPLLLGPLSDGSLLCDALKCEANWLYRFNAEWMTTDLMIELRRQMTPLPAEKRAAKRAKTKRGARKAPSPDLA